MTLGERMMIESGFLQAKKSAKDGGPGSGNFGHSGREGMGFRPGSTVQRKQSGVKTPHDSSPMMKSERW